jgi:hypothetical protein
MFLGSGVGCGHALEWWPSPTVTAPGPRRETIMELLVLAIVVIVAFGLYRFMRTRTAH